MFSAAAVNKVFNLKIICAYHSSGQRYWTFQQSSVGFFNISGSVWRCPALKLLIRLIISFLIDKVAGSDVFWVWGVVLKLCFNYGSYRYVNYFIRFSGFCPSGALTRITLWRCMWGQKICQRLTRDFQWQNESF